MNLKNVTFLLFLATIGIIQGKIVLKCSVSGKCVRIILSWLFSVRGGLHPEPPEPGAVGPVLSPLLPASPQPGLLWVGVQHGGAV